MAPAEDLLRRTAAFDHRDSVLQDRDQELPVDPGIQHELGFAHDLQAALRERQPHGEDRHLSWFWHADYPSTMTAAEKSIRLARASDRIKVIIAQLQVVKNEVDITLLEMRALQAQLEAPATTTEDS